MLPLTLAGRLFRELTWETGDEGVGLRVGASSSFEKTPLGTHVRGALTVGAALRSAATASGRYCGGQTLSLTQRGDDVWLERRHAASLRDGRRQANDFALRMLLDTIRAGAGPDWRPTRLHVEGPPPSHAEQIAELSAGATDFDAPADRLVFPANVLGLCLPRLRERAHEASRLPNMDFVDSVQEAIRVSLALDDLSLSTVAEAAATSVRSLQRRLAACGVQFLQLVDEVRFEQAAALLQQPHVPITDIAAGLGYSDGANFTRAFRRWAGVSPLAFRRSALESPGGPRPAPDRP
ncbi:MAG: helix-turn-helix domain-containing protein [Myxococcota bacterium]